MTTLSHCILIVILFLNSFLCVKAQRSIDPADTNFSDLRGLVPGGLQHCIPNLTLLADDDG
jgi:hypothetical protein